ncbi:hypothetical protein CR513_50400, partial [Mucuna pruriens]
MIGRGRGASPGSLEGQPFSLDIDQVVIPPHYRELVVDPFDGTQDPHIHLQAFQTQVYISGGNDVISCKLFPGTLRGVSMQWFASLPPGTIHTFNNLAVAKGESLKKYLTCFNSVIVHVNNPDQEFFVKTFQKELRVCQFSDSLALRHSTSMGEIRAKVEKHIEAEEDQVDRIHAERDASTILTKVDCSHTSLLRRQVGHYDDSVHPIETRKGTNPLRGLSHAIFGHPTTNRLSVGTIGRDEPKTAIDQTKDQRGGGVQGDHHNNRRRMSNKEDDLV